MSVIWKNKTCEVTLDNESIEGLESGLFEDLKYRPNKYFHPIEGVDVSDGICSIIYQRELTPVDGRISLVQILQVLQGAVDATQRLAQDQVFYLYPDADAFVLDRRRNLRIGLINTCPHKDRERTSQEMCVDAFSHLLAAHCPQGHRRVVSYNKPILTLRHLQQVLTRKNSSPMKITFLVLLILGGLAYGSLYQWGPPRIKQTLRETNLKVLGFGKRVLRSGSEEWHAEAGQERRKREYVYPAVPFTLVIEPGFKNEKQNDLLYRKLSAFLLKEFPAKGKPKIRYQLLVPDAKKFPKAHAKWLKLCVNAFSRRCSPNSWLLHFPAFPGGWRPLVEAIRETLRKAKSESAGKPIRQDLLTIRYVSLSGMLRLGVRKGKAKAITHKPTKKSTRKRPTTRTKTAPVAKRNASPSLPREVLTPRTAPRLAVPRREPVNPKPGTRLVPSKRTP